MFCMLLLLPSLPFPQSIEVSLLQGSRQSSAAGTAGLRLAVPVVQVKRRLREFNIVASMKVGALY